MLNNISISWYYLFTHLFIYKEYETSVFLTCFFVFL
jgi:hypothetical protein